MTVKRQAHRPEAGARAFRIVRIGQDVGVGGITRRRGDGLAVDEVDEGYFVADGLAPVPVFMYMSGWRAGNEHMIETYQLP